MTAGFEYDRIGTAYATRRREDPRLAEPVLNALAGAATVLNVGAGTGSYEPADRFVVGLEPSDVMIAQRSVERGPAVRGVAEAFPFPDTSFDAVMAILTVHHWADRDRGLSEMRRVAPRRLVLTFEPFDQFGMWLKDYIPELTHLSSSSGPSVEQIMDGIEATSVLPIPIPHDCADEMMVAYWRRPEAYLDPSTHAGASGLKLVDPAAVTRGLEMLQADLESGEWDRRYGYLRDLDSFDCGLRLVVGQRRN